MLSGSQGGFLHVTCGEFNGPDTISALTVTPVHKLSILFALVSVHSQLPSMWVRLGVLPGSQA